MAAINNMIRKYGALDEIFGQEQYAQIPMPLSDVLTFVIAVILIMKTYRELKQESFG